MGATALTSSLGEDGAGTEHLQLLPFTRIMS